MLALTSAALSQQAAVNYDLQLSFLLKGGRGIGKFTAASWVAQRLGLHLFEVRRALRRIYFGCNFIGKLLRHNRRVGCQDRSNASSAIGTSQVLHAMHIGVEAP